MRNSLLADVANLMLKSHFELTRLTPVGKLIVGNSYNPFKFPANDAATLVFAPSGRGKSLLGDLFRELVHPFEFSVAADPLTRISCAVDKDGLMTLRAAQDGRYYSAQIPMKESVDGLKAVVQYADVNREESLEVSGKDFFAGQGIPEDFKDLHALVVGYAKRHLGWKDMTSSAQPEKTANVQADSVDEGKVEDEFQLYRVRRPKEKDLSFTGKCLSTVASSDNKGRYWQYSVFQTKGGKFVGVKEGITRWVNESDRVETVVADSLDATKDFFGSDPLAKVLYSRLGLEHVEHVE